jgi:Protein of unknown function (DUF2889)
MTEMQFGEPLHTRNYQVEAFRRDGQHFVLIGSVIDRKPGSLYIEQDLEPFELHHMVVELTVSYPGLVIVGCEVTFNTFPQTVCPAIAVRYNELVGVSIARGFTHQVRERFGGPRGCSHTTALLQAMAPVAVQCVWSMRFLARRDARDGPEGEQTLASPAAGPRRDDPINLNSCHVWDEHSEFYQSILDGTRSAVPMLPVRRRLEELGLDVETWAKDQPGP